jgi:hypothetical protein
MNGSVIAGNISKYLDQLGTPILRESVLAGTTFTAPNPVTRIDGVKYQHQINLITSSIRVQADTCAPAGSILSATGSVTLSGQTLQVCPMSFIETVCNKDLEQYWTGMLMPMGSYIEELSPKELATVYLADKVDKIAAFLDDIFWVGNSTGAGTYSTDPNMTQCNGLLYQLDYGVGITASVITGITYSGALVRSSAVDAIDSMITKATTSAPQILNEKDLTLFLNYADFQTLLFALRDKNLFHVEVGQSSDATTTADQWFIYPGTQVLVKATRGLNGVTGHIILTYARNLVMGNDAPTDSSSAQVWWENLTKSMYYVSDFKAGAQVAYPQYVIYKNA